MYNEIYCFKCGNLVCQTCGCCATDGCELNSCPRSS
jgi:hypothetical protein